MSWIYFIILSLGHMVTDFVPGSILVIMTHMKNIMNLNYTQTTIIYLIIELTSSFAQPIFGAIIDKKNKIPWLMPVGILLAICAISLVGFISNYHLLLFMIFIAGIGVAAFHPQASKATYLLSEKSQQVSAMSIFSIGGAAGMGIAPILVAWFISIANLKGTLLFLIPGILMILLLSPILAKFKQITDPKEETNSNQEADHIQEKGRIKKKTIVFLLIFVILRSWIQAGILNFIPLYYIDYLGESTIYGSKLLTCFLIAGAIGMLIAGPLADRHGLKKVLVYSMLPSIPFTYLLFNIGGHWGVIFSILDGAVLLCTVGVTVVFGQRILSNNIGLASSLMIGVGSGIGAFGATILGYIADVWGIFSSLKILTILPIIALCLVLFLPEVLNEIQV